MQENKGRRNPFLLAPALVLVIQVLFGGLSFISIHNAEGKWVYAIGIASALLIFGFAIALGFSLCGGGWMTRCFGRGKKGGFLLCISAAGMMMVQSAGIRSFLVENYYDYRIYSFYGMSFESSTDSAGEFLLMFFALGVIPLLLEEIFFRGILIYEYRYGGVFLSVVISSFLYAMMGMSLADFPVFFLNGVLLSWVVFLTGNLLYSVLAHLLYALFALSFEKYLFFIALETRILIFLVLVAIGLFAAIGFLGSAEKILRQKGENEERIPVRLKKGKIFVVLKDIFSSPMIWANIGCFALICTLHIVLGV